MNSRCTLRAALILALSTLSAGCVTVEEAQKTGDLVVKHSQQLNSDLQNLEKQLNTIREARETRIKVLDSQSEVHEAYIADTVGFWRITRNETAQHLYDSLRKDRAAPPLLTLTLAPDAKTGKGKESKPVKFYDPAAIEETIKKIAELTAKETTGERVRRIFDFAKAVREQIKKQQEAAVAEATAGGEQESEAEKDIVSQINSSVTK